MDKRASPVFEISLERGEISLTTHKRTDPVAGMKIVTLFLNEQLYELK